MKQCLRFSMLAVLLCCSTLITRAQQVRYLDEVFNDVKVDTFITYATNFTFGATGSFDSSTIRNLVFDIYRPEGDTATNRPLILLSHNGSFLPEATTKALLGFCFGGRGDSSMVELCKRFARRGYVAVSFDYRLGWAATSPNQSTRTKTIIQAVYHALQDAKALVRYFKKDVATNSNQWGVDTSKIVIGGSNSGAYVALAANSLNDTAELSLPQFVDTSGKFIDQAIWGDFDGFGGLRNMDNHPGYTSDFQAVLALGGAIGDTSWIQAGENPVIAFHGVNETGTPYNTGVVTTTTGQAVIRVNGSGDFMPFVAKYNLNAPLTPNQFPQGPPNWQNGAATTSIEGLYPFYGQGVEPWNWYSCTMTSPPAAVPFNVDATPEKGRRYIDTIMGYTLPRLYKLFIDPSFTTGLLHEVQKGTIEMSLFPNPASGIINVQLNSLQSPLSSVQAFDATGRMVREWNNIGSYNTTLDVADLSTGIYTVTFKLTDGTLGARRVTIEK